MIMMNNIRLIYREGFTQTLTHPIVNPLNIYYYDPKDGEVWLQQTAIGATRWHYVPMPKARGFLHSPNNIIWYLPQFEGAALRHEFLTHTGDLK
jgi:hypothetical protein